MQGPFEDNSASLLRGFSFCVARTHLCARNLCDLITGAMIEIVIERGTNAQGKTVFRWSVWSDGDQIEMAQNTHSDADDCEAEAVEFCWRTLGQKPDQITKL